MINGRIVRPVENPDRADVLIDALAGHGLERREPDDFGRGPILKVHAEHYVAFLETAFDRFMALPDHGPEVLPNVSAYRGAGSDFATRDKPRTTGILGQAGWYLSGMSCAIMKDTFSASCASAQTAVAGAEAVKAGGEPAFALCRPPGHHAYADRSAGFCYFNNAAIAAEVLRERFGKVAIADFDTHHGDGTQAIFYRRSDVFFGSTHTDPSAYYPHYSGYADERGAGLGEGANLNLPLAEGSGDEAFIAANRRLAAEVLSQQAEALVLSAGWDAHRDDPLSRLQVTTAAYGEIGRIWGGLKLPTLIVQEGGYSLTAVAEAAPLFMSAFLAARQA
ncbi:MAG: histone deacetylase family protein [Phyllobacterium sp.]